jgi:DNA-binding NarL/FixJ family response regulator
MICDDVPELRELLRHCFLQEPTTALVASAVDGDEALAWAAETAPDVIVTDLGMPGPPPGELVAGLHAAAPNAAIVLYSGSSGAALGRHRGVIRLEVPKGVSPRQLVERIRDLGPVLRDAAPER